MPASGVDMMSLMNASSASHLPSFPTVKVKLSCALVMVARYNEQCWSSWRYGLTWTVVAVPISLIGW
jgi:hypothetical protein